MEKLEAAGVTCEASAPAAVAPAAAAPVAAAPAPAPVAIPVSKPIPVATTAPVAAPAAAAPHYESITGWGWDQNTNYVEVLIHSGLDGVGALPKGAVTVDFTKSSFDLRVMGLAGKNYRLRVTNLDKDIAPERSSFEVKKNRVVIKLKKAGEWDHWIDLVSKRRAGAAEGGGAGGGAGGAGAAGKGAEDPSAALMDMMKQMYEDGDDATRKIIAESWLKSRDERARGPGGIGGGGRGGAGGLGGLGGLGGAGMGGLGGLGGDFGEDL